MLITLLLCEHGILQEPILYLSLYLKQHRTTYYELLQQVRTQGSWEVWLEFFLEGVAKTAQQAVETAQSINQLFDNDVAKIETLGRVRFSCMKIFEYLKKLPQVSVPVLVDELELSAPTARSAVNHLETLGILQEISKKKRDRVYIYRQYLDLLEEGSEPL